MIVRAATFRSRGIETVERVMSVTPDVLQLPRYRNRQLEIGTAVSISVDELRVIYRFLREKGVEIDPGGEIQRNAELLWKFTTVIGEWFLKNGFLNEKGAVIVEMMKEAEKKPRAKQTETRTVGARVLAA